VGLATRIIRVQYACIVCRLGARAVKVERHVPKCPSCQELMLRWPWKGNFPKKTDKLWNRLTIHAYDEKFKVIYCDGKTVKTGPQGWDCHGETRLKPAARIRQKLSRARFDKYAKERWERMKQEQRIKD